MILESDVTTIAYVSAWNRQDHTECARLVVGSYQTKHPWVTARDDYDDEADAHGVMVHELLGVANA